MKKTNKRNKILLFFPALIASISLIPAIGILASKGISRSDMNNSKINADDTTQSTSNVKPLVPSVSNMYNPKLSSKNGPIVFWKNKITSLDWFGAERWSIDVTTITIDGIQPFVVNGYNGTSWKRNWLNFDLDKTNDILYILSNAKSNSKQYAVAINVQTGTPTKKYETAEPITGELNMNSFFMLKVLTNGNLAFLGRPGNIGNGQTDTIDVVDVKTGVTTRRKGNIDNNVAPLPQNTDGNDYSKSNNAVFNLIPIGTNRNLLAIYNLTGKPNTTGDDGAINGTSEVWFILVDDNLQTVSTATEKWQKAVSVTQGITNTRNSKTRPQCDYHVLLDGRVVTVIYDKLIVIDPVDLNNPTLAISTLDADKWIESWSFDSNESLFFKAKNSTQIKKVTLDQDRANVEHPNNVISPYYDLAQSPIDEIKTCANSLVLYNVYGYIGQIMLINAQYQEGILDALYPNYAVVEQKKYGLAVAITNNKDVDGQGDTKGLLNTEKAYQKSADYDINADLLKTKLPSEITRSDITFLNNSFLTQNTSKNDDGTLKYEPFVKNEIDDKAKTLKLTLHLDQIPWFVTDGVMPNNVVPLQITKTFNFTSDINSRFSWKPVDRDDYDFKNTLPSKITNEDIERVSPLVSTLTSQKVTINNINYPKTTYTITTANDTTGKLVIRADYQYLPMELKAGVENLKTYSKIKEYTIFKNSDPKKIEFVGGAGTTTTDISTVPELKDIKESDILPSSFSNAPKQEYLRFINTSKTTGYPLEKINITVTPNDTTGTLTINLDPTKYDNTLPMISKTYTGLNKLTQYTFQFTNGEGFDRSAYLPSDINEEIFYKNFVRFSGFDSSDFELELFPNNDTGILIVNVILMGDYPNGPEANTDFKQEDGKWIAKITLDNFKNTDDYNKEYQVSFKEDGDKTLSDIQKLTPAEIENAIKNKNLTIGGTTYTSVEQLSDLFIATRGIKIPSTNVNNANVNVEMFINNGGGEIAWRITYSNLSGYPNPITFLQTTTGFVKGNEIPTADVLTFCNSNQLKTKQPTYFNMLPSRIKDMLVKDKKAINNFFLSSPTGGYLTAVNNGDFTLEVIADDNTGSLNIRIIFIRNNTNNIDPKSLLEYTQTYTGLSFN
ncbi:lipoprotein 17-related variable surface protein [Malacoplasma muris]|uniref:lipoprotein 17-related variable surface protein n=1 Tax=Malacoplasma muris TaxID=2119 RepID=UPI00398F6793